jgi:HAE1 family hydrophobic/amphiphilic exporter-1
MIHLIQSEKPDVDNPVVTISVVWTGAAPEVVELDIIDILESMF